MRRITSETARRFLLRRQGLLGEYRFAGKEGAFSYVRQAGCIQFDPVDSCGKNAELTLQSRVKGFRKQMLADLLYEDRLLVDYPDKMLSIFPTEDWPYFRRCRELSRKNGEQFPELPELERFALDYIGENGPVSSHTLPVEGEIFWHSSIHWSGNWHKKSNAARSVLEQLYSTGELVIHHKEGSRKWYDLAERHLDPALLAAPDPLPDEDAHVRWRILRRIGAVGLLWDRNSGAFLGVWGLDTPRRHAAFARLLEEGKIQEIQVEGERTPFFLQTEDLALLEQAAAGEAWRPRCEFLAPLDPLLWDHELIRRLFGFDYSWEIYTPAEKRKYGYYVLPVIYGDRFAGRVEAVREDGSSTLWVKSLWLEEGVRRTKKLDGAIQGAVKRFARFNQCKTIRQA